MISQDIQKKILDATHDGMIAVDKRGIITLFNRSAEKLTAIRAEDAVGKNVIDIIDNTRLPIVLQTGKSELNMQQPLRRTTIITNRMPVVDDDGEIIGAIAVFRDVSEIVALASQITNLSEITETLEATINAARDAISVVNRAGEGVLVNPAYIQMTGYRKEELIGSTKLIDGDSVHKEVLRTQQSVEGRNLRVGKLKKEVIAYAAPIIVSGELRGSVEIIHDLTEINEIHGKLDRAKKIIRNLEAKYTFDDIIGDSALIREAIDKAKLAASTPATVVLTGESGTGKELFAHAIHNASDRKYNQFIRVNCAAISENLLESELFGYEEGAFTGASKGGKVGLFEKANGGTLFLDEISELSIGMQAKLLRVLQEKEVLRVGATKPISINVRILSATNVNLEKAVEEKRFRKDLYYRLNYFPILLPPLRERSGDIEKLSFHFLRLLSEEYGRSIEEISDSVINKMLSMNWPGNVRELANFIGRAIINMKPQDKKLKLSHLQIKTPVFEEQAHVIEDGRTLSERMHEIEKNIIEAALQANGYNREKTANVLGISLRSLYYKLK